MALNIVRVNALPDPVAASTIYLVKGSASDAVEIYVTSEDGLQVRYVPTRDEVLSGVILYSTEAPALPNANPFWQKTSTGQLFFQYANGYGDTAWWPIQNQDRYDLTVSVTTSVLDFGINQVFKVDNTTASVKSLVVQNAPANRSMTVPVVIMGKVGTVNFPAGVNWDQGKVPTLSDTKTTLIFFWDGSTLTGSKGHSY